MTYTADNARAPRDVAFKPAGPGMTIYANCMGCNQRRHQAGGKGKPGARWRCAVCVQTKLARAA